MVAHQELAGILVRRKKFSEAYIHIRQAIRKEPNNRSILDLHREIVRHQSALARALFWSAKECERYPYLMPILGVFPLAVLAVSAEELNGTQTGALVAVIAGVFLFAVSFYGLWAMAAAETVIAFSGRYSRYLPESRSLRPEIAFAWISVLVLILTPFFSAYFMSPRPMLFGGNAIVAGFVVLIARWSATRMQLSVALCAIVVPISIQILSWTWTPGDEIRDLLIPLIGVAWLVTIVFALVTTKRGMS